MLKKLSVILFLAKEASKEEIQEFKRTIGEKNSSPAFEGTGKLNPTTDESYDENKKLNTPEEISINGVIGTDNRTRVNTTTTFPHRAITYLEIKYPNFTRTYQCTGFFVGPDTVVTSGHCLHSKKRGGWATSIIVIPGKDGRSNPYSYVRGISFHSVKGWTENADYNYDYGAIKVERSLGNTVGWVRL
jgi:glutamyl endopeptidase